MEKDSPVIVVSGLPRSGTSMMMKMLAAGGVEILTDQIRTADESNPEGYYEFEQVKKLKDGEYAWLDHAGGKAVKVIAALVSYLPNHYRYKVIFMQRHMPEILASQKKMLKRMGKEDDQISDETMAKVYENHLKSVQTWLYKQPNIETLYVNYNEMVLQPEGPVQQIRAFLERDLDADAMLKVINKDLYRERKA